MNFNNNQNEYLTFYGIDINSISKYKREKLAQKTVIHIFEPHNCRKTILLVHGYFDHTGSFKNVINHFLACQYRVISYDLEGHGLSSGKRAEIADFTDYVQDFQHVLTYCKENDFYPSIVLAHSTGAAICTQYLLQTREQFEKVIYLAPLVRAANWYFLLACSKVVPLFTHNLKRKFRQNSSEPDYLAFLKSDPLQCRQISVQWVLAMINWNKKVEELTPSTQEIYIIQGTADETVDWKYNLSFLRKKFPFAQIALITNGRHQLMNDGPPIRNIVFKLIDNYNLT